MDDELDALKPKNTPHELERWNLEDLQTYKHKLLKEAEKIENIIKSKSSVFSEAENLFKS